MQFLIEANNLKIIICLGTGISVFSAIALILYVVYTHRKRAKQ